MKRRTMGKGSKKAACRTKRSIRGPPQRKPVTRPGEEHIFYRDLNRDYIMITHAENIYLYDECGTPIIDGAAGAAVVSLGHGDIRVVKALEDQARKVAFSHLSMFTNGPIITLSNMLHEVLPKGLDRVYLTSGGSEAVESALKLTRQYHIEHGDLQKYKIVSRTISYHGATIGALSMTGHHFRRGAYQPLLRSFPRIPPPYCYRCPFHKGHRDMCHAPDCDFECAWELERAVLAEGEDVISAFIFEPVIGASAPAVAPPIGYQQIIREICDKYNVLMIADEIMSGYGRTGKFLASSHYRGQPDIVTLSKCMSSGYTPLGAMVCDEGIFDVLRDIRPGKFIHGHTFGGNPLSAAVGVEVLKIMKSDKLVERVAGMAIPFKDHLLDLKARHPIIGDARAVGLLGGLEFVSDRNRRTPFDPGLGAASLVQRCGLEEGIYTYPGTGSVDNIAGDHILLAPPYIITDEQMRDMMDRLDRALSKAERKLRKYIRTRK